jgi:polyphosphate glucokinase
VAGRRKKSKRKRRNILVIDVGGAHVKMKLGPNSTRREFRSGPELSASSMVAAVKDMTRDWTYDAISIGYPGPVVGNRPITKPHNLGKGWMGFDFHKAFARPVKVINDATMQALGSYRGGRMLFLDLGTGLGSAMIIDGIIEPMELAHLPYKKGKSFEHYIGSNGLERSGLKKWRKHVNAVVEMFRTALEPEYVVLGGGNAEKVKVLPPHTFRGDNDDAFVGGLRLWNS